MSGNDPEWIEFMREMRHESFLRMYGDTVVFIDAFDAQTALDQFEALNADGQLTLVEFRSLLAFLDGEPWLREQPRQGSLFILVYLAPGDDATEANASVGLVLQEFIVAHFARNKKLYVAVVNGGSREPVPKLEVGEW